MTSAVPFFIGGASAASVAGALSYGLIWESDYSTLSLTPTFGSGTPTITRASNTATVTNSSGVPCQTVNADTARFDYSTAGVLLGLLVEQAATNIALNNRDKTNGSWVKGATMTAAKDQTGVDGAANGASSLTGGAVTATNTCLQTVVLASSSRVYSCWGKRLVGTGTIEMTTDGGTTWVDVTAQFTASYTRISIPAQTVTNPVFGYRITTSGDKIAVDFDQNETGVLTSCTTATAGSAVTRNADVIALATSSIPGFGATTLTMFADAYGAPAVNSVAMSLSDGTSNERAFLQTSAAGAAQLDIRDGGVVQATITQAAWSSGVVGKLAGAIALNDFAASFNGAAVGTDAAGTLPDMTSLKIGVHGAGASNWWNAQIRKLRLYNVRKSNAQLQAMTV